MKNTSSVRIYAKHILPALFMTVGLISFITVHAQDTKAYTFKLGINYNISTGDKVNNLEMWLSDNAYTGIESRQGSKSAFIIFNMQNKKMITVMEAQKMAVVMDLNKYQQTMAQQAEEHKDAISKTKVVKTGVKEKILGYNCDQYKITSEKVESFVWVTTELGSGFSSFSKSLMMGINGGKGNTQGSVIPDMQGVADGVMMKLEATDLSTKKVTKLEATAINKDGKEINISDYKVMSM